MICGERLGNVLKNDRFARARLRSNERALPHSERGNDVDNPPRFVLRFGVVGFHNKPRGGVERRQIVEVHLMLCGVGIFKIDRRHFQKCEVTLAVFRAANGPFHRVSCAKTKTAYLRRTDVNVVGPGEIVRFRRA